ncbi:MAG: sulfotransferase [Isosphaeraceae bacterium]
MSLIQDLLNRTLLCSIQGMTFPTWLRLLIRSRFRVDPRYVPRALVLTLTSVVTMIAGLLDLVLFGWWVRRARVAAPVFILGHYRSGTTHLHNLLALDRRHRFPTLLQVLIPDGFLCTEAILTLPSRLIMNRHRPQDDMRIDPNVPSEDDLALAVATLRSPYLGWVFPRDQEQFARYMTLRDLPRAEQEAWKRDLLGYLKKVSWRTGGRPLILKSPPHTARIRLLLELFPDARFVHIHRDPYTVFQSTRRLHEKLVPYFNLQRTDHSDLDDRVLHDYRLMYDAYLDEKGLIPDHQLCEVGFDELERDPIGTIARIYATLRIDGFDTLEPALQRYLSSIQDYRKNRHPELSDAIRARINREWHRCFEAWGYPKQTSGPHFPASSTNPHAAHNSPSLPA